MVQKTFFSLFQPYPRFIQKVSKRIKRGYGLLLRKRKLQLQLSCLISLLSGYVVIQFYTYCAVFQGLFNAVIGLNISKIPVKIRQFPYDLLFYANANYNCNFDAYNFLCYLGMQYSNFMPNVLFFKGFSMQLSIQYI